MTDITRWRGYRDTVLDECSTPQQVEAALRKMAAIFSAIGGIEPRRSFNGWREDSWLEQGVAINPAAAAFCIMDYQRSAVFLRGVRSAIDTLLQRFPGERLNVLYAGCGPFALQLLPLLDTVSPGRMDITLLDIHKASLDSVKALLPRLAPAQDSVQLIEADASQYRHKESLHLVIVETMQKALEQEPQFAVTANLAPQLFSAGLFIPESIDVELCLADLAREKALLDDAPRARQADLAMAGRRIPLAKLLRLAPETATQHLARASTNEESALLEIDLGAVRIPASENLQGLEPTLFTRIKVYDRFYLRDYDCQLTLPSRQQALTPLLAGQSFRASYQLGSYPRVEFRELAADQENSPLIFSETEAQPPSI